MKIANHRQEIDNPLARWRDYILEPVNQFLQFMIIYVYDVSLSKFKQTNNDAFKKKKSGLLTSFKHNLRKIWNKLYIRMP